MVSPCVICVICMSETISGMAVVAEVAGVVAGEVEDARRVFPGTLDSTGTSFKQYREGRPLGKLELYEHGMPLRRHLSHTPVLPLSEREHRSF